MRTLKQGELRVVLQLNIHQCNHTCGKKTLYMHIAVSNLLNEAHASFVHCRQSTEKQIAQCMPMFVTYDDHIFIQCVILIMSCAVIVPCSNFNATVEKVGQAVCPKTSGHYTTCYNNDKAGAQLLKTSMATFNHRAARQEPLDMENTAASKLAAGQ